MLKELEQELVLLLIPVLAQEAIFTVMALLAHQIEPWAL